MKNIIILSLLISLFLSKSLWANNYQLNKPKLILQITVDQLRGDLPTRYLDRLSKNGFRYLLNNGTYYKNAHYLHANTETAVGHATLFTGAHPAIHGIISNDWINPSSGKTVYNVEDHHHRIIGKHPKEHEGVSPKNLLSSTIGDELVISNAGKSRVFSVSTKDRGAIIPAGHAGKAFWYSKSSGNFVTSNYYYDSYPKWVEDFNSKKITETYRGKSWELINDNRETYLAKDIDYRAYESNLKPMGKTFPHYYGDDKHLYLRLALTPAGDELVLDFAKNLIENEKVGQSQYTDFLAISFSSTDYVGHLFGPSSLESEDNLLRLDANLENLLTFIDKKIGLKNTVVILSADHGAPEAPEYAKSFGINAKRFDVDYFKKEGALNQKLKKKFGKEDLIKAYNHPYLYLDLDAVKKSKFDVEKIENFIAKEIMEIDGIYYAQTRSNLLQGKIVNSDLQSKIINNFHPKRSGNIHIIQDQYWFLHSTNEAQKMGLDNIATIHGSPWAYDSYVPIFIAGRNIPQKTILRKVSPADIAPTIASYLDIKPPSGSSGKVLVEVFGD